MAPAAYIDGMTDINAAAAVARENARHATGRFGAQEHTAPEATLTDSTYPHLDAVNARVHTLHDRMCAAAEDAFLLALPQDVQKVTFEEEDGGWFVTHAEDTRGLEVTTARDFEDVEEMMAGLGDGESGMPDFLVRQRDGSYTWEHSSDTTNPRDDAQAVFEGLSEAWALQRERSQQVAALSIRAAMPDEADELEFEWSDQGPHLTLTAVRKDGAPVDITGDDGFLRHEYEDLSFASTNIGNPSAAGLTDLGRGRYAMTRSSLTVDAAGHARLHAEAADAEAAAATVTGTEKWHADAAAEYARARADLTLVAD